MPPFGESFPCPGCRQEIRICHPASGCVIILCPVEHCRRELWALPKPAEDGVILGARTAPDLSRRFAVDQERLLLNGEVLLCGPGDLMADWADRLNDASPDDDEIPDLIRWYIQHFGRGCAFHPGRELVRLGVRRQGRGS